MAYTTKAAEYLRGGGATNNETDDFFFISVAHLKVHHCRSENLSICLCSHKNDTLKISHSLN